MYLLEPKNAVTISQTCGTGIHKKGIDQEFYTQGVMNFNECFFLTSVTF